MNMYNDISTVLGSSAAFRQHSTSSVISSNEFFLTEISGMIQIYIQLRSGPVT